MGSGGCNGTVGGAKRQMGRDPLPRLRLRMDAIRMPCRASCAVLCCAETLLRPFFSFLFSTVRRTLAGSSSADDLAQFIHLRLFFLPLFLSRQLSSSSSSHGTPPRSPPIVPIRIDPSDVANLTSSVHLLLSNLWHSTPIYPSTGLQSTSLLTQSATH